MLCSTTNYKLHALRIIWKYYLTVYKAAYIKLLFNAFRNS